MSNLRRRAELRWKGEGLHFEGRAGEGPWVPLDGDSAQGPSPMEALLLSLAGCMAVDVKVILEKGRVALTALEVEVEGLREPEPPQRYRKLRMAFRVQGPDAHDEGKMHRALELSRNKYCSVFHTLRPDLEVEMRIERA